MRCMRSSRKGHGFRAPPFSALSSGITDTTSINSPPRPAKLIASRPLSSSAWIRFAQQCADEAERSRPGLEALVSASTVALV